MSLFRADAFAPDLAHIVPDKLTAQGVRLALVDRDNTVLSRETGQIAPSAFSWVSKAQAAGISVWLVSNNIFGHSVAQTADALGVQAISAAMKPAPFALLSVIKREKVEKSACVVIGDQVFTDVVAAHLAGVRCIQVLPLSTSDMAYTKVFRLFEKHFVTEEDFRETPSNRVL